MTTHVSTLIPCYNAERWIGQAIESALCQDYAYHEVIVIDDGSTDSSLDVIKSFGDRVRWETGPNQGGNAARNRLLKLSKGKWLQYLDADDYLLQDKISGQIRFLSACRSEPDVVFGPVILERGSNRCLRRERLEILEPHDPWILLASWRLPQTGAALWRKQAILDVGGWKHDQPCCQEHELYLRMLMNGKHFVYCGVAGAVYRQWSQDTLCNKDVVEVNQRRIEIEQRLENYLREKSQLSPDRLHAINETRFRIARAHWHEQRDLALSLMNQVQILEPDFMPSDEAATARYRLAYKYFGFSASEILGNINKVLTSRFKLL